MLPLLLPAATVTAAATGLVSSKSSQGEAILRPFLVAVAASLYSIVIASLYDPAFVLYLAIVSVRARESVSKAYLLFSSQLPRGCSKRGEAAAGAVVGSQAGYMNDVCSSLCIIHTMPKALRLTHRTA
jgi:hypothetical protein